MTCVQEGVVLQVVHGRMADGPYYQGDGEWGSFGGARIYYSRGAMRDGLREAKEKPPEDGAKIVPFRVYV